MNLSIIISGSKIKMICCEIVDCNYNDNCN